MKQLFALMLVFGFGLMPEAYSQSAVIQPQREQNQSEPSVGTVYFGLTYASPLGTYRQAYPHADAFGGTFGLLVNPRKYGSPLELGVQAGYMSQGRTLTRTHQVPLYRAIITSHNIVPLHLVARVKPQHNLRFKPYVDGLAGITVYNTRSKVKEGLFDFLRDEHQAWVLSKYNATLLSYGLGFGVLFPVGTTKNLMGDIRLTYLQSPFADYVQKGHVSAQQDGLPVYHFTRSETSMLLLQLNIAGVLTSL